MELLLERIQRDDDVTIGELTIDGEQVCWICEDKARGEDEPKVYGETAIPVGRYRIRTTWSPRFQCPLPLLFDVPGYQGVRIHPGNTAADTEGCLLPGRVRLGKSVRESRLAFAKVQDLIAKAEARGEEVWITVTEPEIDKPAPQEG
ncbi:MAG TPA: DUF5675 family protein [Burkholderiaceae bacterium]|nr:DUF5675 family protein [Burkholderiaceae bacterium]